MTASLPGASQGRDSGAGQPSGTRRFDVVGLVGRFVRSKWTRAAFFVIVLGLLVAALVDQGGAMWRDVQRLSAPVLLLAFVAQIGSLAATLMVWRELLADLGSRLSITDAWRINFIAQLGKYMPGKVWQVVAQAELSKDAGVPRARSAVSVILTLVLVIVTGGLVGAATLPFAAGGTLTRYLWFLVVVPVGFAILSPPVMNRFLTFVLKVLKRAPLEKGVSLRGLLRATAWSLVSWACTGLLTFALLYRLGDHHSGTFLLATGGYALSWTVGFLALIAPAGIGAREAVLVATFSGHVPASTALAVALITRGFAVVGDAAAGLVAVALLGGTRLRRLRAAGAGATDAAGGGAAGGGAATGASVGLPD